MVISSYLQNNYKGKKANGNETYRKTKIKTFENPMFQTLKFSTSSDQMAS
jgi:hypothetical protein